ncbi:outer membrane protein assembly factor BamB family protein [Methanocaldococcus jannaschii]|nr:PQQ-binding-like beta-propeller repeat protein [Methanocaldococcus jannaschii]
MVFVENKINGVENIRQEIDNLNVSNYKEIYDKFKNVFSKNRDIFNYYVDKLIELMKNLDDNELSLEIDKFMLCILKDSIIWEFKAGGSVWDLSIKDIKDNIIILGCSNHLFALDIKTGNKIWEYKVEHNVDSLFIKDNIVMLEYRGGHVCVLDVMTGDKIWESKVGERMWGFSLKDNIVILGDGDKYIYAIDVRTGGKLWEFEAEWCVWELSIKDDKIILRCEDEYGCEYFYVLDIKTGEKILEFGGEWHVSDLLISGDVTILADMWGCVYALDTNLYSKIQRVRPQLTNIMKEIVKIDLTLLKKSLNLNEWDELPIQITNKSLKDITISKISIINEEDILFKDIEPIKIRGRDTKVINLFINPKVKGKLPIDIVVEFEDEFNIRYKERFTEVLTITKFKGDNVDDMRPEKIDKILKQEIDNLNTSNYKEIYSRFKNIFNENRAVFNYYMNKLIELVNNSNDELAINVGKFILDILGIKRVDELLWEFRAEGGVRLLSIKGDIVILGCVSGHVYAIDIKTGKKLWEFKAEDTVWGLSIKDDIVVLGCGNIFESIVMLKNGKILEEGYAYALDINTGREIWRSKIKHDVRSLSIKDDIVVLGCKKGYILALDINAGNMLWEFKAKSGKSIRNLSIKNDILLFGCDNYLYALDIDTGRELWRFKAEGEVKSLSIKKDNVLLGCRGGYVYLLDINTGEKMERFKVVGSVLRLSIKDDIVILGCNRECVYALDINAGENLWAFKTDGDVNGLSIKNDAVLLGCDNYLYALDINTGEEIWKFKTESAVLDLSIKDNIVISGCKRGHVYALDFNIIKNYSIIQKIKQVL